MKKFLVIFGYMFSFVLAINGAVYFYFIVEHYGAWEISCLGYLSTAFALIYAFII